MSMMDIDEIKKYLPHRYPFLLVDRILEVVPGKSLTAIKNVTVNEPFFNGHFPEGPIMPGVLIIEALAQASGILIFKTDNSMPAPDNWFFLGGVDNARFKRVVRPGDQLRLEIQILRARRDLWKFKCEASVDGQLACSAEILNVRGSLHD
jgi:3-hydroxyacyl-[acyl-carrier-protein] dehydratase